MERDSSCTGSVLYAKHGVRPHVSLAVYTDDLDQDNFSQKLLKFAESLVPFDFRLSSVGTFPTAEGVVFLAPVVTHTLLAVHEQFHTTFSQYKECCSTYYFPGNWVAHCTVAIDLKDSEIPGVVKYCWGKVRPIEGRFREISLIEFLPVKELATFSLG